ncbi:MAG: hypothetical protein ABI883_01005 [Chthoniobacterales bacterium]
MQCIEKLEAALRLEPANQLARVYLGSAYTLRSRDLGFGPQKLKTLNQGVALMDQAVAAAPNDGKLRLARALTVQSLPFFLGRAASARKDFAALAEMDERNPAQFDQGDEQIIFHQAALAAVKSGDRGRGAALFRQALQHPSDSALARKSEAELALLK